IAFKDYVTERRGDKLPSGADLFTGDIWVGAQALENGIADGIGHLVPKMKERYGDKLAFAVYGPRRSMWRRFGARLIGSALAEVEDRANFARYGL
ncbi:MAG: S49 family peptidase, partial [Paracoccaceae bacterium]